jgi:hypothetical protein
MSQSAVVAVAAAFIVNGVLTWANFPAITPAISWIISGILAFVAGFVTMKMGKK